MISCLLEQLIPAHFPLPRIVKVANILTSMSQLLLEFSVKSIELASAMLLLAAPFPYVSIAIGAFLFLVFK